MNHTTPNSDRSTASGIDRGGWIGGGLMGLAIIALATTLAVKNDDALRDPAAGNTAAPLVAANTSGAPTTVQSSVAKPAPVNESMRPVH